MRRDCPVTLPRSAYWRRCDTGKYLQANPDVAAAHVNPLEHFLGFGRAEGRQPFSVPGVAHYLLFGKEEGRSAFADGVWG